jgi:hypothetical protein
MTPFNKENSYVWHGTLQQAGHAAALQHNCTVQPPIQVISGCESTTGGGGGDRQYTIDGCFISWRTLLSRLVLIGHEISNTA